MATYPIQIPQLGVQFSLTEDWTPSDEDIWDAVKQKIPPQDMFSAYHRGEKEFVRNAYRNGYFKGGGLGEGLEAIGELGKSGVSEVGTGIAASKKADVYRYHYKPFDMISATGKLKPHEGMFTFENEKGEVRDLADHAESLKKGGVYLQGLLEAAPVGKWDAEGLMKEAIVHSGMGRWPNQKDVRRWITTYMTDHDKARGRATTYKGAGNIIYGYPMMGEMAGAWFSQAWLDDDEQIDNWIETYEKVNKLEEGRQRSAQQVAMQVGDMETFRKLRAEEVKPREGAAFLAEMALDPANIAGGLIAKGVTAPVRASLTGATKRTLLGLQDDLIKQGALQGRKIALNKVAIPSGEVSARKTATDAAMAEVNKSIAARDEILAKYGGQGFVGRLTGSPVSALAAEEALDLTTDAGKRAAWMAREALAPRAPKTLSSRLAGRGLQVAGGSVEWVLGRLPLFLKAAGENAALKLIQKSGQMVGKELTEQQVKNIYRTLLGTGAASYAFGEGDISDEILIGLSAYLGPRVLATVGRDMRVIGGEMALAQTTDPFFRRLGALPTPAEGLVGAAKDRTNVLTQGWWPATKAAVTDPAKLSIRGTGAGVTPYLSGVPKGVSRFLDTTGLGRPLEGAGRFGGAMAEGMALPAGIGYVGSGGEPVGAVVGGAIAAPFTFIGAGLGKFANYRNKGDLARKQLGDVEYFRDHLTPKEKKEFDAMSVGERMVRASVALSMPDLMIEGQSLGKRGSPGYHRVGEDGSVVVYNKDTETPIHAIISHEGGHHIETHGLTELVNRIMFGDPDLGTAGVYVKRTKDGKPVYRRTADGEIYVHPKTGKKEWVLTGEIDPKTGRPVEDGSFLDLRQQYLDRLAATKGVTPEEYKSYRDSPEKIGREIFAERYSALKRSGELQRHIDRGPVGRLLATVAKVIFPESFTKSLMLKLGVPIDKDGKVVRTGIFKNLQRIPEIDAIIKKYAKDTAGKTKAEIESAFPMSEEFKQSFSIEDQRDPTVRGLMNTGGVFKTNPDGSLVLDSMGNPKRMTKGQLDKLDEAASAHAFEVLERHGVEIKRETGKDGVEKKSATFKNLTEEMIDELDAGPFHSRQIEALRKIAAALRDGDGQEAGFLLGYFAASKSGRPQPLPYRIRKAFPYEFELTQGGNILIKLLDPSQLEKNYKFLKKDPRFLKWARQFANENEVWTDLRTYTANQVAGRPGSTGLGDDKANFLNALLGGLTQEQVELNPILQMLGWKKASAKGSRAPFGPSLKSFRLDRVFKAERTGEGMLFDYSRAERLMMPRMDDETVPLPFIEDLGGEEPAAGFKRVATQKMRKGEFEKFQKPLEAGEAQEAMGNQSQVQPFQPRFPKGERQFMPAAYHGTPHTFKAEEGAPMGRFRSAQIGTGEGAQAFGHGLYFAEKKQVADHYRKVLQAKPLYDGKFYNETNARHIAASFMLGTNGRKNALERLTLLLETRVNTKENPFPKAKVKLYENAIKHLENKTEAKITKEKGSLYKVELAPKENEYLLWDKPLSEQPKGVREKLEKMIESDPERMRYFKARIFEERADVKGNVEKIGSHTGAEIYTVLTGGQFDSAGKIFASAALLEAGIPGIKYLEGASRAKGKGDYNYVIFDEGAVTITDKLFMPGDGTLRAKGDEIVRLEPETLRLFMPASEKVNLQDYADRPMFALTSDRLGVGEMFTGPKGKKKAVPVEAQGGRGFMHLFNGGGWAFKGEQAAKNFMMRVREIAGKDDSALVGITILSDLNHLKSAYGQLAYANALRAAIDTGTITEASANRHIRAIMKAIKDSKDKRAPKGKNLQVIRDIKNFADFEKAVKAKKINFALADWIFEKAGLKKNPITETAAKEMGIDLATIAKDIADPELVGAGFGEVVALLEVPVTETPKKTDFHYSYPYTIEGKNIGFLKEFADVGELTTDPKIRTRKGDITAQPLMTVMPQFDLLPSKQFMPAGEGAPRAPRRAARPAPQGNRFMAPASKRVAEEAQLEKFLR